MQLYCIDNPMPNICEDTGKEKEKMQQQQYLILGFDPGGIGNFGWSICQQINGRLEIPLQTGLADNAWQAKDQVQAHIPDDARVLAAGIDAPLYWDKRGDMQGFRGVDHQLQAALENNGLPVNHVASPNGLYGAVIMQGALLARVLSCTWDLAISESHPTALNLLLPLNGQPAVVDMWENLMNGIPQDVAIHERDATLAAISGWAAIQRPPSWQNLYDQDARLINPSSIPSSYWMPIP